VLGIYPRGSGYQSVDHPTNMLLTQKAGVDAAERDMQQPSASTTRAKNDSRELYDLVAKYYTNKKQLEIAAMQEAATWLAHRCEVAGLSRDAHTKIEL